MKQLITIVFMCFLSMVLVACQEETDQVSIDLQIEEDEVEAEEVQLQNEELVFKANEEAFITDENGKDIYSLTINSVKETQISEEDKQHLPNDSQQTVVVTYTYKYINQEPDFETITISPIDDLTVYDKTGLAADFVDLWTGTYPFDSRSPDISPGRTAKAYSVFSLKNASDVIQIDSGSMDYGMFSFNGNITFELPIEKP